MTVLLRNADIFGWGLGDVFIADGAVREVGVGLPDRGARVLECAGGLLLPGLHDHHCHLLAAAAAEDSTQCGPPQVRDYEQLGSSLRRAAAKSGWVRGVGYDESVAGDLDRSTLDAVRSDVAIRVQHRSGALWVVNSAGAQALRLDNGDRRSDPDGIERDPAGLATGRLWRLDPWLRLRLGGGQLPDVDSLSLRMASYGITGVTDATPDLESSAVQALKTGMRQRLVLMGDPTSSAPRKIVVADHELPSLDDLVAAIERARPRAIAAHCVTRASLLLVLVALGTTGAVRGDRIEHAAVVPPEAVYLMRSLGLTVVTQPSLVACRGDDYLDRSDPDDAQLLWPYQTLLAAGIGVGCSSDAPHGDLDPWRSIQAAALRCAPSGRLVNPRERVSSLQALLGFLSEPTDPGGPARMIRAGVPADLVQLDSPLADVLADPRSERVRATMIAGEIVTAAPAGWV